jgi:hypothetical protein
MMSLTIRDAQMEALALARIESFVQALSVELRATMPDVAGKVADLPALVRHGVHRAGFWGVRSEPAVGRFVRMQLVFGRDFDVDPTHAWAAAVLADLAHADDAARMNALTDAARARFTPEAR